jgi:hypothetical protein
MSSGDREVFVACTGAKKFGCGLAIATTEGRILLKEGFSFSPLTREISGKTEAGEQQTFKFDSVLEISPEIQD